LVSLLLKIMSYGMRNGSFTGHTLARYISGTTCDYYHARCIINKIVHDMAQDLARYATKVETILRASLIRPQAPSGHRPSERGGPEFASANSSPQ
jgi:hypothetical protein